LSQLHSNELSVDEALVRRLLASQFPEYAGLTLQPLGATGSSNVQFRLGSEWLVRLPRQPGGGESLIKEQVWGQYIGERLPVAVPGVLAIGKPEFGYPEPWSLVRWLPGQHPVPGSPSPAMAKQLAELNLAFAQIEVPSEARQDRSLARHYRGRALADYDSYFRKNLEDCRQIKDLQLDLDKALDIWESAINLPHVNESRARPAWFHGDLVAENLLVEDGQITGLLDLGGLGIGDPTIDLHGIWELLDASGREAFRQHLAIDDATWLRGRAWALAVALMTFPYYWRTMPGRIRDRLVMAEAALSE
jgi:aminoglycoside phosphotransferase (APT) family kinase protein